MSGTHSTSTAASASVRDEGPDAAGVTLDDLDLPAPTKHRGLLPRGATVGRYVVLDRLGAGGMGVVYAAYDPELDRKVALKLVLASGTVVASERRARLEREAQAMARLNHPHVVTVHDVGSVDGDVYVAMEYVEGGTLGDWMRAGPRRWPEVLEVLLAAGRGLAAAHAKGLVHRDFKPDNVMVGDDGRVLVMDFGLARETDGGSEDEDPSERVPVEALLAAASSGLRRGLSSGRLSAGGGHLTRRGSLVGTPSYMAPEQLESRTTDARTDQFAYCVTLYEALYGERPFAGDSVAALCWAVTQGELRPEPKGSSVPGWLRRVVVRGLATAPEDRWPSMDELLAALQRDPSRARLRVAAVAGLVALAGLGIGGSRWSEAQANARCDEEGERIVATLGPSQLAEIERAMTEVGVAYADDAWEHTRPRLEAYAQQWQQLRAEACRAGEVEQRSSPETLRRARECFDERRDELGGLVQTLQDPDEEAIQRAATSAAELPPLSMCTDAAWLARRAAPPEDPALRERVAEVRAKLAAASSRAKSGAFAAALADAQALGDEVEAIDWTPLSAEAALLVGHRHADLTRYPEAEQSLDDAFQLALRSGHDLVAARAAITLVTVVGSGRSRHDEGLRWGRTAGSLLDRLDAEDSLDQADLHNALGSLHKARGAFDEATAEHERALALRRAALGDEHPAVAQSLNNLGTVAIAAGRPDEARRALERALEIRRAVLGPRHPAVGKALLNLGSVHLTTGDIEAAAVVTEQALALWTASLGPQHQMVATALHNMGNIHYARGDHDAAQAVIERAIAITAANLGEGHIELATSYNNLGSIAHAKGDTATARRHHEHALRLREQNLPPEHPELAQSLHNLAILYHEGGDSARAVESLERAVAIWEVAVGTTHPDLLSSLRMLAQVESDRGHVDEAVRTLERVLELGPGAGRSEAELAHDRFALAQLLGPRGGDLARARALAEEARRALASAPKTDAEAVAAIDAWLASLPSVDAAAP